MMFDRDFKVEYVVPVMVNGSIVKFVKERDGDVTEEGE